MSDDDRLDFPATGRNREVLWEILAAWLPAEGRVLEVASGSGQHAVHFAQASARSHPGLRFLPSDPDPEHRRSIAAWAAHGAVGDRIEAPADVDTTRSTWTEGLPPIDAVLCINMIHIAPWAACEGLMQGASGLLGPGARLCLYGPFMRDGQHTAPSNEAFCERLQARDPAWGVRDLDDVRQAAERAGFDLVEIAQMPANNLTVRFDRR